MNDIIATALTILSEEYGYAHSLSEESSAKLQSDVLSLKRIGWKLDKVIKHLITSKEYGMALTSDIISGIYDPPKAAKIPVKRIPVVKKITWPKAPTGSQKNNWQHAEAYMSQAMQVEDGGAEDAGPEELFDMLKDAGYSFNAIIISLRDMGREYLPTPRGSDKNDAETAEEYATILQIHLGKGKHDTAPKYYEDKLKKVGFTDDAIKGALTNMGIL